VLLLLWLVLLHLPHCFSPLPASASLFKLCADIMRRREFRTFVSNVISPLMISYSWKAP
jgi:hypothetical protein